MALRELISESFAEIYMVGTVFGPLRKGRRALRGLGADGAVDGRGCINV